MDQLFIVVILQQISAYEFSGEESTLKKAAKGIKNGISIAQEIGKRYNNIAQWVGLPQVPKPFLRK